jgi:hypothetical protein
MQGPHSTFGGVRTKGKHSANTLLFAYTTNAKSLLSHTQDLRDSNGVRTDLEKGAKPLMHRENTIKVVVKQFFFF